MKILQISVAVALALTLASCGNTIRGVGKDAAGVVGATKDAGHSVAKSF